MSGLRRGSARATVLISSRKQRAGPCVMTTGVKAVAAMASTVLKGCWNDPWVRLSVQ